MALISLRKEKQNLRGEIGQTNTFNFSRVWNKLVSAEYGTMNENFKTLVPGQFHAKHQILKLV